MEPSIYTGVKRHDYESSKFQNPCSGAFNRLLNKRRERNRLKKTTDFKQCRKKEKEERSIYTKYCHFELVKEIPAQLYTFPAPIQICYLSFVILIE
jgi:hypothetical protein